MSRRRKSGNPAIVVWLLILGPILVGALQKVDFTALFSSVVVLMVVVAVIGGIIFGGIKSYELYERRALMQDAEDTIGAHVESLSRRYFQLVRPDSYGRLRLESWDKEVDYFITHNIAPLAGADTKPLRKLYPEIVGRIKKEVDQYVQKNPTNR